MHKVISERYSIGEKSWKLTDTGWLQVFGSGDGSTLNKEDYYQSNVWVYACLNAIAQNIGAVPFKIYKGGEEVEDYNDPVVRLFREVNPTLSRYQLFESTALYRYGWGECFWVLEGSPPREIWIYHPSRFQPIVRNGRLEGWVYEYKERERRLKVSEVVFFKMFNPYNDLRGMSPATAARFAIDIDYYSSQYNKRFFSKDASPGIVLKYPRNLTPDDRRRVKEDWRISHEGVTKAHDVAILEGGIEIERTLIPNKDMQFIEARKMSREEICAIWKVPPAEVGIMEYSRAYANTSTQDKGFWFKTLIPGMKYFEDILYTRFFKVHYPEYRGEFDLSVVAALHESMRDKVETARVLFGMGYPANVVNERLDLGLPNLVGGDVGYLNQGLMQVSFEEGKPPVEGLIPVPIQSPDADRPEEEPDEEEEEPLDEEMLMVGKGVVGEVDIKRVEDLVDLYSEDLREVFQVVDYTNDYFYLFKVLFDEWAKVGDKYIGMAYELGMELSKGIYGKLSGSMEFHQGRVEDLKAINRDYMRKRVDKMYLAYMTVINTDMELDKEVAFKELIGRNEFRAETFGGYLVRASQSPVVSEGVYKGYWCNWIDRDDNRECGTCRTMAAGNPWRLDKLPRLPGENTECNGRCRCSLQIITKGE